MSVCIKFLARDPFLRGYERRFHNLYKRPHSASVKGMHFSSSYRATLTISFLSIYKPTTVMNITVKTKPIEDIDLSLRSLKCSW